MAAFQEDGDPIFVARATVDGSVTNGMLNPKLSFAQISYAGQEYKEETYEVLVFNSESPPLAWVAAQNGDLPGGAIQGGQEANGDPLYVVKALVEDHVSIGKLNPKYEIAYFPHNGTETGVTSYEVLVASNSESTTAIATASTTTTPTSGSFQNVLKMVDVALSSVFLIFITLCVFTFVRSYPGLNQAMLLHEFPRMHAQLFASVSSNVFKFLQGSLNFCKISRF